MRKFNFNRYLRYMIYEICCGHLSAALTAKQFGAKRIELCAALPIGGITPDPSTIKKLTSAGGLEIMSLIRPREGNFNYSKEEKIQYFLQIEQSIKAGTNGLVIGALDSDKNIDFVFIKEIVRSFPNQEITFHRAFDFVKNPSESIRQLIDIGIKRVLTSGQKATAFEGYKNIKHWYEEFGKQISIMPGAGINLSNIHLFKEIGIQEIHLSAKKKVEGIDTPLNTDLYSVDKNILEKLFM